MNLEIFGIRDVKMEMFVQFMFEPNAGVAMRKFAEACQNPDAPMSRHPEDFALWHIGSTDQVDAKLVDRQNEQIATALQYAVLGEES